jgi:hypothetical protein
MLNLDVSTLQRSLLHLDVSSNLNHGVLCCSWRCLYTETCFSPGDVYTTGAWAASRRVYTKETCAASGHVCTKKGCAAPGCVYTTEAGSAPWLVPCTLCLHCRGLPFFWRCLHYRGLSCIWTCLRYRSLCCTWTCLHHKGPELHRDLSTLERAVQLLEVSTLQGTELSLDYFEILLSMR